MLAVTMASRDPRISRLIAKATYEAGLAAQKVSPEEMARWNAESTQRRFDYLDMIRNDEVQLDPNQRYRG